MRNRLLTILLTIFMVFTLAGCDSDEDRVHKDGNSVAPLSA